MFHRACRTGFMVGEATVLAVAWALPLIRPNDAVLGRFAPLVIAAMTVYATLTIVLSAPDEHTRAGSREEFCRLRPPV